MIKYYLYSVHDQTFSINFVFIIKIDSSYIKQLLFKTKKRLSSLIHRLLYRFSISRLKPLAFLLQNTFILFVFSIFWLWEYLIKVIPETYLIKVIPETYLIKVIPETYLIKIIPETYLIKVIPETYLIKVIPETYLIKVIPETYLIKVIPETCRPH